MVNKTKQQSTEWEKFFTNPHIRERSDLQNVQRTQEIGHQKNKQSNKKWSIDLNRELSTEECKMAERHLKKSSTSLDIREMQIRTTLRFHLTPVRMAKIRNKLITTYAGVIVGKREHFCIAGGNAGWYSPFGCQYGDFSEN